MLGGAGAGTCCRERGSAMVALRTTIFMSWMKPRPTNILPLWRGGGFAAAGLLAAGETAHRNALPRLIVVSELKLRPPGDWTARLPFGSAQGKKPCYDEEQSRWSK